MPGRSKCGWSSARDRPSQGASRASASGHRGGQDGGRLQPPATLADRHSAHVDSTSRRRRRLQSIFVAPARLGEGRRLIRPRSSPASGRRRRRRIKLRSLRAEMQNGRQLGRAPAWAALEDCCGSITWRRRRPKSGHYLARRGLARWLGRVGQKTIRVHCASPP